MDVYPGLAGRVRNPACAGSAGEARTDEDAPVWGTRVAEDAGEENMETETQNKRNAWGSLVEVPTWTRDLLTELHATGAWKTGIDSGSRGGTSINEDVVSIDGVRLL